MKKSSLLILILFLSTSLYAQVLRGYGFKGGLIFSQQTWDYTGSGSSFQPGTRTGINVGTFVELLDAPILSIVTEINYCQKGAKEEVPITTMENPQGTGETITWDARLDYINISLLGKGRLNYGLLTPYILAGPYMDFEINKSIDIEMLDSKKSLFGVKFGLGAEVNLSEIALLAEVTYQKELNKLFRADQLNISTNSFELRVGIMF